MKKFVEDIISTDFVDAYTPTHQLGPDYVIPTDCNRTWLADGSTEIQGSSVHSFCPQSVVTFMKNTVDNYSNHPALAANIDGNWIKWTYGDYWNQVNIVARAFIKLGLQQFHAVSILGFNSPEWFFSYLGAIFASGFAAGIYTTSSSEVCFHILADCSANIIVVENDIQLQKILPLRNKLSNLKVIVQYSGQPKHPDVISWEELLDIGRSLPEEFLTTRIKGLAVNQCCCLIYTSGTTGNPKGVMVSHDQITYITRYANSLNHDILPGTDKIISYLPLSHVAATFSDIFCSIYLAGTIYFATPDALKGKLIDVAIDVRPTTFLAVPRIYEKIYEKLYEAELRLPLLKRVLFIWSRKQALKYHSKPNKMAASPLGFTLAKTLVLNKLKKLLGLDQVNYFRCGGARVPKEILDYLLSLDIILVEGFGMSETCGPHVTTTKEFQCFGSVGKVDVLSELKTMIYQPDDAGCGEILLQGRNIFMGYLQLKDKTLETIDDDGWLHTGDLGRVDKNGYLFITGRIKELIVTSGGENIPPVPIEENIKKLLPIVSNCMVIGEGKKYLTMLLTFKTEFDLNTYLPMDKLALPAVKWCQEVGSSALAVSEILDTNDQKVSLGIQAGVDKYNKDYAMSNAQRIQKWTLLANDLNITGGELGPTGKLRRSYTENKYSAEINRMYSE